MSFNYNMYFFPNKTDEKRPSMNDFARPSNSVLLNNHSQLEASPNPIMERPQFTSITQKEVKSNQDTNSEVSNKPVREYKPTTNNTNNLDPYEVLGIQPNCSLEEAKISYKYLALQHHPDKGGDQKLFDIVTKAYETISQRLRAIQPKEKVEHNDLKKASKRNFGSNKIKINMNGKKFDLNKFNDVYEKNRITNPYEKGYSDWKEDLQDENISIGSNISTSSFNSAFAKSRQKNNYSKQIIQHDEPQATISGDLGFSELGIDEVNTFSKNEGDSNSINFTDYKDAYTTESKLIDPDSVIIDRPDSIGKYKNERENINFIMSEEQKQLEEIKQKKMEETEFNRMQRVSLFDEMATEQYNKVNQMMLGNS